MGIYPVLLSISNNSDRQKILATVAATVFDFMKDYPEAAIFVTGSTASRTKLYQMSIAKGLEEIKENFEIKGWIDNDWQPLKKEPITAAFTNK